MSTSIGIIDYGVGNLRSIQKAFEAVGVNAIISSQFDQLINCDKLILPGVGAFGECQLRLNTAFADSIYELLATKPTLGICVGMQLLFESSDEFNYSKGLGLIKGNVNRIRTNTLPVPHTGWNKIEHQNIKLFDNIEQGSFFYFNHSYACQTDSQDSIATTDYDGSVTVAVQKNNLYGVQFHPEKSSVVGLKLLENFATTC